MHPPRTTFILGSGAIGFPLAAYLCQAGRRVVAVRTSRKDDLGSTATITVDNGANRISTGVETISLSGLTRLDGLIVIAAKSHANQAIAQQLKEKGVTGPIVIMQNGIGVERPFLEKLPSEIYRCVLYTTSQANSQCEFTFRPVTSSPIGIVKGTDAGLIKCVESLSTDEFPFHAEANILRETWKKAIINTVFNSICPLLEIDNGVFARDDATAGLARELVRECLTVTDKLHIDLDERELMERVVEISRRSDGQLISTLQDIRRGRQTEIEYLNLEVAHVAAALRPALCLPRVELLGRLVLAKSRETGMGHPWRPADRPATTRSPVEP